MYRLATSQLTKRLPNLLINKEKRCTITMHILTQTEGDDMVSNSKRLQQDPAWQSQLQLSGRYWA